MLLSEAVVSTQNDDDAGVQLLEPDQQELGELAQAQKGNTLPKGAHLANLSPKQKAYQASLADIQKSYCTKSKIGFCIHAKKLASLFEQSLKMQITEPYADYLKSVNKALCSKAEHLKSKHCQILNVLKTTMVSVAHMGPHATERLGKLQQKYLKQLENLPAHYCSVDHMSLFCQDCRGLKRHYKKSLKQQTNIQYETYLTNMDKQWCGRAASRKANRKRCQLLELLRRKMPISATTFKTLPEKHVRFLDTVTEIREHFCVGKNADSLRCELARGTERMYIHSLNGEDNSAFDLYTSRVLKLFCSVPAPGYAKFCKTMPIVKSGVPPAFLAEGVHRAIHGVAATANIQKAQGEMSQKITADRQAYLKTLQDIHKHYCGGNDSHPGYFCLLTVGLVRNYKYSLSTSHENWEYKHLLAHMTTSFCVHSAGDGYDKRCKFLPMLKSGLPASVNEASSIAKRQNEYLHAMQDIVGHFCYDTTQSVFCQLSHGLVGQYIASVSAHDNQKFINYLQKLEAQQCGNTEKKKLKKCKIFPVLRKGIPGTGLEAQEAIAKSASAVAKAQAALRAAQQIRTIAQEAAKREPTKTSLDALEKATHREIQAEKDLQWANNREIRKVAEKAGAPSIAAVQQSIANSKQAKVLASAGKSALSSIKATQEQRLTRAKAQVLQATMKLAEATKAVKKDASPRSVAAVEGSMKASSDAKSALKKVAAHVKVAIQNAQRMVQDAEERSRETAAVANNLKLKQTRMFAEFAAHAAQKRADEAQQNADVARAKAKQMTHKIWWARLLNKQNPSKGNKEKMENLKKQAHAIASEAKSSASEAMRLSTVASEANRKMDDTNYKALEKVKLDHARNAARHAQTALKKVQTEVSTTAGKSAMQKLVQSANKKKTTVCNVADLKLQAAVKANTALKAVAAKIKVSPSAEVVHEAQALERVYAKAKEVASEAKTRCKEAKALEIKLMTTQSQASLQVSSTKTSKPLKVEKVAEVAAQAEATVEKARKEEDKAVSTHLKKLKDRMHQVSLRAEHVQDKLEQKEKEVSRLTQQVAEAPTRDHINALKQALTKKRELFMRNTRAQKQLRKSKLALDDATKEALSSAVSKPLQRKLKRRLERSNQLALKATKKEFSEAMSASQKAQRVAKAQPTAENVRKAKQTMAHVQGIRQRLDSISAFQAPGTISSAAHESVKSLEAELNSAIEKKRSTQQVAMAQPTDSNLDVFRAEVRTVHRLQAKLLVAQQQAANNQRTKTKQQHDRQKLKKKMTAEDLVAQLVDFYCKSDEHKKLCTFYKKFQNSGWHDKTGKMAKHLLQKVANLKKTIQDMKQHVAATRAAEASNSTPENASAQRIALKKYKSAQKEFAAAQHTVNQFMKHQHDIEKMKATKVVRSDNVVEGINKLVQYYCAHNKKLCSFYKGLRNEHVKNSATSASDVTVPKENSLAPTNQTAYNKTGTP